MTNISKNPVVTSGTKILLLSLCLLVAAHTASAKSDHHHKSSASPQEQWDALAKLQEGNKRFAEGKAKHPQQSEEDRVKLTDGQSPPAIVLSCSDSRVPPEVIFDQGLGQVFTVRVAGNVANSDAIASIEYALEHLGSKILVVMGHDSCGAVGAALNTPEGKSAGSPHLDGLIGKIRPNVSRYRSTVSGDKTLRLPVKSNVTAAVRDLIRRSKIVREFVESDRLLIAQGVYHLASGKVDFWSVGQPVVIMEGGKDERKPNSAAPKKEPAKPAEAHSDKPKEHAEEPKAQAEDQWKKSKQWKQPEAEHQPEHEKH